ncbi:MAG: tryptophan--tRNA ligase [bacterium]
MKTQKTIFSGIKPSGDLNIGHYFGAIRQWAARQNEGKNYFCIVDLHAITVPQDPEKLAQKTRETAAMYLACGIDPEKSVIFIQSQNSDHTELAWILNCFTPVNWMERMIQFKEKAKKQKEIVSLGLFSYPVLMAADILLYNTTEVPVGEDQKQHVELARDIARSFNSRFKKEIFIEPEAKVEKLGARIMDLQDPKNKMSKSAESDLGIIFMLDGADAIRNKIKRAVTDSGSEIKFDLKNKPAISNLLTIFSLSSGKEIKEIEEKYAGRGYGEFKKDLAESVVECLKPIQEKYNEIILEKGMLDKILNNGLEAAKKASGEKIREVKDIAGVGL